MCPTFPRPAKGDKPHQAKHDSGKTSTSKTSGDSGRHRDENWDGGPVGSRTDRPHHPDGWTAKR